MPLIELSIMTAIIIDLYGVKNVWPFTLIIHATLRCRNIPFKIYKLDPWCIQVSLGIRSALLDLLG